MYIVVSIAILVTMVLALVRALMGPSVYDRVLAVNVFGTKTYQVKARDENGNIRKSCTLEDQYPFKMKSDANR